MRNLSEKSVGFIGATVLAVLLGLGVYTYQQYKAGQITHQKTEILFNLLAQTNKHGALIEVTDNDGTKRPATRIDLLVLAADDIADNIKRQQDAAKQTAAGSTDGVR